MLIIAGMTSTIFAAVLFLSSQAPGEEPRNIQQMRVKPTTSASDMLSCIVDGDLSCPARIAQIAEYRYATLDEAVVMLGVLREYKDRSLDLARANVDVDVVYPETLTGQLALIEGNRLFWRMVGKHCSGDNYYLSGCKKFQDWLRVFPDSDAKRLHERLGRQLKKARATDPTAFVLVEKTFVVDSYPVRAWNIEIATSNWMEKELERELSENPPCPHGDEAHGDEVD